LAAPARAEKTPFKLIHVDDLAAALKSSAPPDVYDANGDDTRENVGVIPGARLLTSSSKYDVATTLPADKSAPLVFYCANKMCMASHTAAQKAVSAGYANVSVMTDGIFGWRDAGQPCAPVAGKPKAMDPQAVSALAAEKGAVIVDVRENEERFTVIPGARSMPMSRIADPKNWKSFVASLPKNEAVVFHCASGGRAKKAAEKLSKEGYAAAYFKSADQWKAAGLPVEKGPAR
ncbi:MAG: rhodanese-like domain-containing protein, partial [Elusimicrobia bacterium]|nr:rhodanese-like domain-containing protein [Elusimicrobiota bacterium]